jgi:hypothetical protein
MSGTTFTLYQNNSQYLDIAGVKDQSTSPATYLNSGTATATLYDATGASVPGFVNVTGQYQASSSGEYRFPVDPSQFNPSTTGKYTLKVDITSGSIRYHVEYNVKIATRNTGLET